MLINQGGYCCLLACLESCMRRLRRKEGSGICVVVRRGVLGGEGGRGLGWGRRG